MGGGGRSEGPPLGGRSMPEVTPEVTVKDFSDRAPAEKPSFTVSGLKKAIPPHCFERSLFRSSAYLVTDLMVICILFYLTRFIDHPAVPRALAHFVLWPLYWVMQGSVATGVWVIAHECGHQAFSDYGWVNDAVGTVLHSCLMVPYFSWKYSHRRHHSNTGSMERDEVFVPTTKEEATWQHLARRFAIVRLGAYLLIPLIGWPLYLTFNSSGRKYPRWANHFNPTSPIFNKNERFFVALSDAALLAVWAGLYIIGSTYGYIFLLKVYFAPLAIVNGFLVLITFLQHTHSSLPHYALSEWDWLRGALATIDRDYGILNHVHHHIADTHVAHHLFSTMPHYHAEEATRAIKPILGEYYRFDGTPIALALWREIYECAWVDEGEKRGVYWFAKEKSN